MIEGWDRPEDQVLPRLLARRARELGPQPFLRIEDGPAETFAAAYQAACRTAGQLTTLGVRPGERVPLLAGTSAAAVHAWFGINLAAATDVPLNTAARGDSLVHAISLTGARLLVTEREYLPRLAEAAARLPALETVALLDGDGPAELPGLQVVRLDDVAPGPLPDPPTRRDIASVLFTSGTTGPAKGVLMTHAQTYAIAAEIVDGLRLTSADTFYCFHPMFHMTRFGSVCVALLAGGPVVLDRRFDPAAFLDRVRACGATATIGHGPMLEAIWAQPERPGDADNPLRTVLTAPLPARIAAGFERRFAVRAIDTWGMTEVTCVTMRPYDTPLRPGCCGRPRDDLLEVAVVDPVTDEPLPPGSAGEITVRPREPWVVMQGYLGMPETTLAAWRNFRFHTGDYGHLDADGYLWFAERSGDGIRRRAENVSAADIEAAADAFPGVKDCAAVGVASQFESDDDIKLCVVTAPGPPLDPLALTRHLVGALPHHMVPRYIEFLDEIPRSATDKIQRQALRASGTGAAWDRIAAGVSVRELAREIHGDGA